jgi:carboxymethylenebutenolidase
MITTSLATPDGPMTADIAVPADPNGAGVVVVQEAFGVNGHIRDVARRLSESGYLAIAPHLFHRSGDPTPDYADIASALPHMAALTAVGLADDLRAAVAELTARGVPPARVGIVGFCMGGSVALFGAVTLPIGASVGFYGGGITTGRMGLEPLRDLAPKVQAPFLGHYGDEDAGIPVAQVEELRHALDVGSVPTQIVRYPDAGHAFHCDARPAAYREQAATAAWGRTLEWFGRYLGASDAG